MPGDSALPRMFPILFVSVRRKDLRKQTRGDSSDETGQTVGSGASWQTYPGVVAIGMLNNVVSQQPLWSLGTSETDCNYLCRAPDNSIMSSRH